MRMRVTESTATAMLMATNCSLDSYWNTYTCPGDRVICTKHGTQPLRLPLTATYLSLASCSLSVLGSLLIVISYWRWREMRTGSRGIVTYLAIADFFTAAGYVIAGSNYLHYYGQPDASLECVRFQQICEMQSFITTWSSMSSFAWTAYLAVYLYLTIVRGRTQLANRITPFVHIAAWLFPYVIVYSLLARKRLGFSSVAVSNWCFIRTPHSVHRAEVPSDVIVEVLLAGKLWEFLTYCVVVVLYTLIKLHIRRETREGRSFLSQDVLTVARRVDQRLTLVPVLFLLLRMWGSLQFVYSLIVESFIFCGCVPNAIAVGFQILGVLQVKPDQKLGNIPALVCGLAVSFLLQFLFPLAIGDGGQGWGNALVLSVLARDKLKQRLFDWKGAVLCNHGGVQRYSSENPELLDPSDPQHQVSITTGLSPGRRGPPSTMTFAGRPSGVLEAEERAT